MPKAWKRGNARDWEEQVPKEPRRDRTTSVRVISKPKRVREYGGSTQNTPKCAQKRQRRDLIREVNVLDFCEEVNPMSLAFLVWGWILSECKDCH